MKNEQPITPADHTATAPLAKKVSMLAAMFLAGLVPSALIAAALLLGLLWVLTAQITVLLSWIPAALLGLWLMRRAPRRSAPRWWFGLGFTLGALAFNVYFVAATIIGGDTDFFS